MSDTAKAGTTAAEAAGQDAAPAAERTFTQAEMDAIIGDRLSRERAKYADYDELKQKAGLYDEAREAEKTDLQKVQEQADQYKTQLDALQKQISARDARDKVSAETGVPASLLTGDTEEACKTQAEAILTWRGAQPKYPATRDGGEIPAAGGKTRDKFADWFAAQINHTNGG